MDTLAQVSRGGCGMKNETEDRRSRRSRRLLKEGLLALMREKRFSEITVRDITERMDLNRGTFYLHYPDTTALLQSVETDMLAEAQALIDAHMAQTREERTLRPVFEPILDYVVEHREVCQALFVNNSSSNFTDRLHQLIRTNGLPLAQAWFHPSSQERMEYLLSFVTYGLIGLMKTWFDQGMTLPKETLVSAADRMVQGAGEGLLETSTT